MTSMEKHRSGSMLGVIPHIGIKEFFDKLHEDSYDPDYIYTVWAKMAEDPDTLKLMQNNVDCGVCKAEYWLRLHDCATIEEDEGPGPCTD